MSYLDPISSGILLLWFTVLGTCVGSFLNVVIYRMPLGKSLSQPPSHCPQCGHAIRWYDNVPVLGWLWLRGKCRDCHTPINIRYPFVEGVGGLVFGTITYLTLQQAGDSPLLEFCVFVLSLSGLVLTFFAAIFIKMDGQKIPIRLIFVMGVLGALAFLLFRLYFVPASTTLG